MRIATTIIGTIAITTTIAGIAAGTITLSGATPNGATTTASAFAVERPGADHLIAGSSALGSAVPISFASVGAIRRMSISPRSPL